MRVAASPAPANITGASFTTGGGHHFASPTTNNNDVSSESPAPFKLPEGYIAGIPERCISTETRDHGEAFFKAKNGQLWYKPKDNMPIYIDDGAQKVQWSVEDRAGTKHSPGSKRKPMTKLQAWLMMYGSDAMESFFSNTNAQLKERNYKEMTSYSEAIKFQGIMRLCTRFEFSDREKLWSTTSDNKFIDPPCFGEKTGMVRDRFRQIFTCQRYSKQPTTRPEGMSSEQYRWMLIDDHVLLFNKNRAKIITPSGTIVVDESISRWYGVGGDWINAGLPMYIAMDRKPENGCEIQDSCDGETGIMLQLKLVKTKVEEDRRVGLVDDGAGDSDTKIAKGTKVVLELVKPWTNTDTPRIILGDSAFASLPTCDVMKANGLRFMGPIKTAHKGYCHEVFNEYELSARGQYHGLYTIDDDGVLDKMAYVWLDRNRMQFISNCSHLYDGGEFYRVRLRQVDTEDDAEPEHVEMLINQPEATAIYYRGNGQIDEHNRTRQQVIQLEKKLKVKEWHLRVNHTILGINDVDTYRFGKAMGWWKTPSGKEQTPLEFLNDLIEEMIDNTMIKSQTARSCTQRDVQSEVEESISRTKTRQPVLGLQTNTKRARKTNPDGTKTLLPNTVHRTICTVPGCNKKTPKLCTICNKAICCYERRPLCWKSHCEENHLDLWNKLNNF